MSAAVSPLMPCDDVPQPPAPNSAPAGGTGVCAAKGGLRSKGRLPPSSPCERVPFSVLAANDDAEIPFDLIADTFGRLELRQREAWARELGLDPRHADLRALPSVAPDDDLDATELLARMSA